MAMRTLNVSIPDETAAKLLKLAERDYRAPRQQAAALLAAAIEREDVTDRRRRAPVEPVR